jgi:ubiquinone/menaquinone biosynthesis C-methylase UbiE
MVQSRINAGHTACRVVAVANGSVDAVTSGLVLNFVPDPASALAEFVRVE